MSPVLFFRLQSHVFFPFSFQFFFSVSRVYPFPFSLFSILPFDTLIFVYVYFRSYCVLAFVFFMLYLVTFFQFTYFVM